MKTIRKPYTEEDRDRLFKAAYRFARRHGLGYDEADAAKEFRNRPGYTMGSPAIVVNIERAIYHRGDTVDRKMEAAFARVFCRAVRIPYNRDAFIYAGMVVSPGREFSR